MSWIPGWDAGASAHWWSNFYFWISLVSLILLGVFEAISHRYSERKDELAATEQQNTQDQHDKDMAALHLKASEAQERAEKLERENLEIRQKVAGRRISKEQHDEIVKLLSPEPATFDMQMMQESEAGLFAADILKTLDDAGWTVDKKEFPMGEVWTNLTVFITTDPAAGRLATAFQIVGIPFSAGNGLHGPYTRVTIMVGGKPSPF